MKPLKKKSKSKSKSAFVDDGGSKNHRKELPLKVKKKKNKKEMKIKKKNKAAALLVEDLTLNKGSEENMKKESSGKKKRNRESREDKLLNQLKIEAGKSDEPNVTKTKKLKIKKRKSAMIKDSELEDRDDLYTRTEKDDFSKKEKKKRKATKTRNKLEKKKITETGVRKGDGLFNGGISNQESVTSKKAHKIKTAENKSQNDDALLQKSGEAEQDDVYQISSGDEDCSRGMKKWITEYHQSRPGLKILQQKIDDFIVDFWAQEEKAKKEKEALVGEDGWTVVVHHKGRKKTTDSESGIAVGSVSQAAMVDKMAKKKDKDIGLDFYRFQKREAQRNEIMKLQTKFEEDKKRIQQLRAARKFKPY